MAVPAHHVLATSPFTGLLVLLFAVVGFAVVALVAAVVLVLLHAVLPGEDTGAEEVHRAELEASANAAARDTAEPPPDLRSGTGVG